MNRIIKSVSPGHEEDAALALPTAHALLAMAVEAQGQASSCSLLTPAIRARLKEMGSGQVLEVRVNDPTARGDIESWCRMSGNELLAMTEGEQGSRFFVKKK
jgi:TusA-related sulfurtransferase